MEALWSAEFFSNLGMLGAGVVVFETGRIFGGDASFYYIGDYKVNNQDIEGNIEITRYQGNDSSVIGPGNKIKIRLTGKLNEPTMELKGYRVDMQNILISVNLTKRADLP